MKDDVLRRSIEHIEQLVVTARRALEQAERDSWHLRNVLDRSAGSAAAAEVDDKLDLTLIRQHVGIVRNPDYGPDAYTPEGRNVLIRALVGDIEVLLRHVEETPDTEWDANAVSEAAVILSTPATLRDEGWEQKVSNWLTRWRRAWFGPGAEGHVAKLAREAGIEAPIRPDSENEVSSPRSSDDVPADSECRHPADAQVQTCMSCGQRTYKAVADSAPVDGDAESNHQEHDWSPWHGVADEEVEVRFCYFTGCSGAEARQPTASTRDEVADAVREHYEDLHRFASSPAPPERAERRALWIILEMVERSGHGDVGRIRQVARDALGLPLGEFLGED